MWLFGRTYRLPFSLLSSYTRMKAAFRHLCAVRVDYLIIGQGLCGSWLSYYLLRDGATVVVADGGTGASASASASGIINPITGKRLARQWMADAIEPFVQNAYDGLGSMLGEQLTATMPIHNFFSNAEEAAFFAQKADSTHGDLLSYGNAVEGAAYFSHNYGSGSIYPATLVNLRAMLDGWRRRLKSLGALLEASVSIQDCVLEDGVRCGNVHAKAVIDCRGAATAESPYFNRLPFALNKGEAVTASIAGLPRGAIYKFNQLSIVPWSGDGFWIGSSYDWDPRDVLPTDYFRDRVARTLNGWLRLPYTLHEHFAAIRPATVTRDAFVGMHPAYPQVGILNGMGSKGCSLAPFLAHNLAKHLLQGEPLLPQVDIARYARTLSR